MTRLGLKSIGQLEKLAKKVDGAARDDTTEAAYLDLDRALLPRIELVLFYANFSNPGKLFCYAQDHYSKDAIYSADQHKAEFRKARVTYFGVWEPEQDRNFRDVEIAIEATFVLKVWTTVNVENTDDVQDGSVGDQLLECRNMFNFSIKGFDYEDDEVLEHEWRAHKVSPAKK